VGLREREVRELVWKYVADRVRMPLGCGVLLRVLLMEGEGVRNLVGVKVLLRVVVVARFRVGVLAVVGERANEGEREGD